jgi:hypothetical protein
MARRRPSRLLRPKRPRLPRRVLILILGLACLILGLALLDEQSMQYLELLCGISGGLLHGY